MQLIGSGLMGLYEVELRCLHLLMTVYNFSTPALPWPFFILASDGFNILYGRPLSVQYNAHVLPFNNSIFSVMEFLEIRQSTIWYTGSLGRWDKRLVDQASDIPSIIFFSKIVQNSLQKPFHFFFYKITKMKIKSFECPKSIRNYEKNTWNVRCLVDESFVPSAQRASVLYWRLSDF